MVSILVLGSFFVLFFLCGKPSVEPFLGKGHCLFSMSCSWKHEKAFHSMLMNENCQIPCRWSSLWLKSECFWSATGLLQVLLPLLLALAALDGHLEQPSAPHAEPEEQGLQLEQTEAKGPVEEPPPWGEAARQRRAHVPASPQSEGTVALHQALGISL